MYWYERRRGRLARSAELGGTPYGRGCHRRCSPITYANRNSHAVPAARERQPCPAEQTEQLMTVLRVTGYRRETVRFPGTPQGARRPYRPPARPERRAHRVDEPVCACRGRERASRRGGSPPPPPRSCPELTVRRSRDPRRKSRLTSGAWDRFDLAVGQGAHASRARPVVREAVSAVVDHRAGAKIAPGRLHRERRPQRLCTGRVPGVFLALDQHLAGAERELRAHRLELAEIVLVHACEYRTAGGDDPVKSPWKRGGSCG